MSFGEPLAGGSAFGRFLVQELRLAGRAAALRKGAHRHQPFVGSDPYPQRVADAQLFAGFGTRAVDLDFSACHRCCSTAARFEETRGPEPTIEAN